MARLCVRIAPNEHPTDPALTPMRTQIGDVVVVVPDEHVFSFAEMNNGQYRIIDVPGVAESDLAHLVAPRVLGDQVAAKRSVSLNPATLNNGVWRSRRVATKAQIEAIVVARA